MGSTALLHTNMQGPKFLSLCCTTILGHCLYQLGKAESPHPNSRRRVWGGFPGGPVVKTSHSSAGGGGSIPSQAAKIPHA